MMGFGRYRMAIFVAITETSIKAMGPSAPNGPPVPMAMAVEIGFPIATFGSIRLFDVTTASMCFGNAVAFDLRRTLLGHETDDDPADHGNYDDPWAELIVSRTAKMERPDVIEREIRKEPDQVVEQKSDDACNHADPSRQNRNEAQAKSSDRFHLFRLPRRFYKFKSPARTSQAYGGQTKVSIATCG
jgi:hypothetical protein